MKIVVIAGLLPVAACAADTAPPAAPLQVRTVHLICAKTIPLDINHDGETAVVKGGSGQQVILHRDHSSAAPRYAGSGYALMRQDGVYIFTAPDGAARDCDPVGG